jgi:hypothetical protein
MKKIIERSGLTPQGLPGGVPYAFIITRIKEKRREKYASRTNILMIAYCVLPGELSGLT